MRRSSTSSSWRLSTSSGASRRAASPRARRRPRPSPRTAPASGPRSLASRRSRASRRRIARPSSPRPRSTAAARSIWLGKESWRSSSTCGSTPCACAVSSACASNAVEPLYIDAVHIFTAEASPTSAPTTRASIQGGAAAASASALGSREVDPRRVVGARRAAGDRAVDELEPRAGEDPLELPRGRRRDRVPVGDERTRTRCVRAAAAIASAVAARLVGRHDREDELGLERRRRRGRARARAPLREPGPGALAPAGDRRDDAVLRPRVGGADRAPHRAGADDADVVMA